MARPEQKFYSDDEEALITHITGFLRETDVPSQAESNWQIFKAITDIFADIRSRVAQNSKTLENLQIEIDLSLEEPELRLSYSKDTNSKTMRLFRKLIPAIGEKPETKILVLTQAGHRTTTRDRLESDRFMPGARKDHKPKLRLVPYTTRHSTSLNEFLSKLHKALTS